MTTHIYPFSELTTDKLYDILRLRSEVFVVEQDCVYQDVDGKDAKAWHLLGYKAGKLVAYARIFKPGDYFDEASVGRVIVAKNQRMYGYGHRLMQAANTFVFDHLGDTVIRISAQAYLENFYAAHGYRKFGNPYLEDGIPHVAMRCVKP